MNSSERNIDTGLLPTDERVLRHLVTNHYRSGKLTGDALNMSSNLVTASIRRLRDQGLVRKGECQGCGGLSFYATSIGRKRVSDGGEKHG